MNYRFVVSPDKMLITLEYTGEIDIDTFKAGLIRLSESELFNEKYGILIDLRSATFSFNAPDIENIVSLYNLIFTDSDSKSSLLVNTALETAFFLVFLNSNIVRETRIFSTEKAALQWLTQG